MRSPLILKHLTSHELPAEWAMQLPSNLRFSVVIVTEKTVSKQLEKTQATDTPLFGIWRDYEIAQDVEAYVRHLRSKRFETS
jgi:hypothetical protein